MRKLAAGLYAAGMLVTWQILQAMKADDGLGPVGGRATAGLLLGWPVVMPYVVVVGLLDRIDEGLRLLGAEPHEEITR